MAHGSYRPPWRETAEDRKKKKQLRNFEIQEAQKTLRLCSNCGKFNHFLYVKIDIIYIHFACPLCGEMIQVPRTTTPNDDRKWG